MNHILAVDRIRQYCLSVSERESDRGLGSF